MTQAAGGGMRTWQIGVAMTLAISGCTSDPGFTGVTGVREVSADKVASCAYIADFRATPGVYGALADQGLKYARNSIRADALRAGADTLVFDTVVPGADVYELHAVAYKCG